MHIILVSDRLATAKTLTVTKAHLISAAAGLSALVLAAASALSYFSMRHAAEMHLPFLSEWLQAATAEESERSRAFVRENLNAMAVKLGEMQAQLTRLDSLGERLAGVAGVKLNELRSAGDAADALPGALPGALPEAPKPGRGGPLVRPQPLSERDLQRAVDSLAKDMDADSDALSVIESRLFAERIRRNMLPTSLPVATQWSASSFGWRIDPFTGERALHEGVDFPADIGTPIRAAAAGVVVASGTHPQYGQYVDVDHGRDLVTRYAHASKLLVTDGALIKRGQTIALVGNSGRSTGPHLHFEVRYKGTAVNPNRFLQAAQENLARR